MHRAKRYRADYIRQQKDKEHAKDRPREIHIYYKLLEKPLPYKKFLEVSKVDGSKETA